MYKLIQENKMQVRRIQSIKTASHEYTKNIHVNIITALGTIGGQREQMGVNGNNWKSIETIRSQWE